MAIHSDAPLAKVRAEDSRSASPAQSQSPSQIADVTSSLTETMFMILVLFRSAGDVIKSSQFCQETQTLFHQCTRFCLPFYLCDRLDHVVQ